MNSGYAQELIAQLKRITPAISEAAVVAPLGVSVDLPATLAAPTAAAQGATYDQTAINGALDAKADNAKVAATITALAGGAETRLDALEEKVNAILTSLKNAGHMAVS